MSDINIEVPGGTSIRLLTAGKYCDKNIVITALGDGNNGRLPLGYFELTYIQSTGTQYIDTVFKANNNTRLVIDIQMTNTSVNNQWLYGARDATRTNSFGFYWYNSAFGANFGTGQNSISVPSQATDRLFIDHNKNIVSFNGVTSEFASATWSGAYNLSLFAVNTAGTSNNNVRAKLYSCRIYDNGTLIRDFVPCKTADDEVGLYDLVNDVFYANKGTGEFVGGELVNSSEYPIWTGGYY